MHDMLCISLPLMWGFGCCDVSNWLIIHCFVDSAIITAPEQIHSSLYSTRIIWNIEDHEEKKSIKSKFCTLDALVFVFLDILSPTIY